MNLYKQNAATQEDILRLFSECDFEPKLESYVDTGVYTQKILTNAERFECWIDDKLTGLVALYANDTKSHLSFITMVCVGRDFGGRGIATALLGQAISHARDGHFTSIELEVYSTNDLATRLYERLGFVKIKNDSDKILMSLNLLEKS